jgi:hypothetical protein
VTARTRSALTPALVLLAAAALAYVISLIPTLGVAHGSTPAHAAAVVDVVTPAAQPAPRPSDQLHDPLTDLGGAIDDAEAARRQGWPILVLVGVVLVSRGLGTARRRWPGSRALRWMSGRAGLLTIGSGAVAAAAFDAFVLGGSWFAAGYAALGAALALIDPGPTAQKDAEVLQPAKDSATDLGFCNQPAPRAPESGHIALPLLGCVAVVFLAGLAWGCASLRPSATATAGELVDCTLVSIGDHADELEAAIRDATDMRGAIDWETPRALVRELGADVGGCALRLAIERLLASPGVAAGSGAASLTAGWHTIRTEDLGGRRYMASTAPATVR